MSATRIGIAIVQEGERFLIGIRSPGRPLAGYAEFPGGKCEPGESAEACAVRECLEETGLAVTVERLLQQREFTYPHGTVELHFFLCRPVAPTSDVASHQGYRWVPRADLQTQKFPEANDEVVQVLLANPSGFRHNG